MILLQNRAIAYIAKFEGNMPLMKWNKLTSFWSGDWVLTEDVELTNSPGEELMIRGWHDVRGGDHVVAKLITHDQVTIISGQQYTVKLFVRGKWKIFVQRYQRNTNKQNCKFSGF